jgi:hypothetical protein
MEGAIPEEFLCWPEARCTRKELRLLRKPWATLAIEAAPVPSTAPSALPPGLC